MVPIVVVPQLQVRVQEQLLVQVQLVQLKIVMIFTKKALPKCETPKNTYQVFSSWNKKQVLKGLRRVE